MFLSHPSLPGVPKRWPVLLPETLSHLQVPPAPTTPSTFLVPYKPLLVFNPKRTQDHFSQDCFPSNSILPVFLSSQTAQKSTPRAWSPHWGLPLDPR